MFPVLYSPNETVDFLGFFSSWIQEAYLYADPDPKHWCESLIFKSMHLLFVMMIRSALGCCELKPDQ